MHRKLFNLARDNAGRGTKLRLETTEDTDSIYVYDIIDGDWGISATDMVQALAGLTSPNLDLHINCPGGDVFEARAMMTAIAQHPATVTAKIDGLAASAASVLALAADTVEIAEGGFFMIHNAWSIAIGNASDFRTSADLLDKIDATIVADYVNRSGKPAAEVQAWMAAETWFSAQEAVDAGFANSIMPTTSKLTAQASVFNLAVYDRAPAALTEPPAPEEPDLELHRQLMASRLGLFERTAA